jgi:hypothetical protein
MDKQSEDVTRIKFVTRKDHRGSVRGELFDQRVAELFYACWPRCYRGHKKWYSDLAGISTPSYYRIEKGLRGVSRKHFHILNLMEVMLDRMGKDAIRRLGPGFIMGVTEYAPSPGTFASRRGKSRTHNHSRYGVTG